SFVAIAGGGGRGHGQKLVGYFCQRAHDNDWTIVDPIANDGGSSVDCGGILHRGTAEFHYDHRGTWGRTHHGDTEARRKNWLVRLGSADSINLGSLGREAVRRSEWLRQRPHGWCCETAP